jgi:T1SS-143 domain-containing protein
MATLIGVVSQVVGEVFAVAGDGTRRPLVEGDRVYAGEQLETGAAGAVAVTLTNGEVLTLGRDSSLGLNEQMLAGSDGQTAQPQEQAPATPTDGDLTDVEQLQAAIEAGVDPTQAGEATAAGPGAGGGAGGAGGIGGGHSFVLLGEVGGALDPVIGFPTEGLNTGPEFPDPEPIVTDEPAADFTPSIEIEYEDGNGNISVGPAIVDEEALADGTNPGSGAEQASGNIIITSPDGVASLQIQGFDGVWVDVTNGGVVVGQYGTLTVDAAGNWTYTLTDNTLDHPNAGASGAADQVGESFPVRVFDLDGDVSPTVQLNVLVNDDAPILTEGEGAQVAAIVDEDETSDGITDGDSVTNVASGGPGTLSALVNFGADGIGSFGLSGSATAISSLEAQGLTSGGTALSYSVAGNVLTASAGGETIFTLQVGADGSFTFTLVGQLDHPTADGNDDELLELPIDFSGVLTAVDGDGDSVGTFTGGSFVIDVEDDVPQWAGDRGEGEEQFFPRVTELVHEDALTTGGGAPHDGNPEGGQTTTVSGLAGSLSALVDFGADGPGDFGLSSDVSSMDLQGLTSGGDPLTYEVVGNVLTATAGGETIFTLTVNADGSWEFVLQGPIDHPIADGSFDSEDLPGLGVDFSGILTATDGDGDPLVGGFPPGSFAVDIEDDVPVVAGGEEGNEISGVVHEDALTIGGGAPYEGNPEGGQTTIVGSATSGSLSGLVSFGADGPGDFGLSSDVSSMDLQGLTSDGDALSYAVVGNVLTATAGGETIFTLTVNADGSWEFVLEGPLDHPVADGSLDGELLPGLGIDFSGVLTVTDGDGDPLAGGFPTGSFTVNVEDDVPRPDGNEQTAIRQEVQEDALTLVDGAPYEGNDEGGQTTVASGDPGDLFALIDFGADGPGTVGLSSDTSSLDAQDLMSEGTELSYSVIGNVLTATANGNTIFTLRVDADGGYEFVLSGPLDHPIADSALDDETLAGLGIDFSQMITATDGDGDPLSVSLPNGSFAIDVEDDVPVAREFSQRPWVSNQVDEDELPGGITDGDGVTNVANGAAGALYAAINFGADGPGTIGMTGSPVAIGALETQGLTSGGVALSFTVVGNLLTATAGGDTIFTLQVNGDGSYTFTLSGPLDHPVADGTPAGDNELLGSGIDFSSVITATDGDGDPLSGVNPGSFVIRVEDDIPVAVPPQFDNEQNPIPLVSGQVDEDELTNGIGDGDSEGTSVSGPAGTLNALVNFGADGPGDFGLSDDPADIATLEAQGLTSDSIALSYSVVGNVLTATAGGNPVFTLTVNADGSYSFELQGPLDHPLPGSTDDDQLLGLPIDFSGVLTATDGDGDPVDGFADGSFVINVEDDVPEAQNDNATVLSGQAQNINLVFVLDFSGSIDNTELNAMLDAVRAAGQELFNTATGAVQIQIVAFSGTSISFPTIDNIADFTDLVNSLNPQEPGGDRPLSGLTDFTDAIQETMAAYTPLPGWTNQVIFISDGNPNEQTGPGGAPSLTEPTATDWNNFVDNNGINVTTIGIGDNIDDPRLEDVDVDAGANNDPLRVDDFDDLVDTLVDQVIGGLVGGNVLLGNDNAVGGGDDDAFGADGRGQILSIEINGTTYTWDGTADGDQQLTDIATAEGGKLSFNFSTGAWSYQAPANVAGDKTETFTYTIVDNDGDPSTATLNIYVEDGGPVEATVTDDAVAGGIPDGDGLTASVSGSVASLAVGPDTAVYSLNSGGIGGLTGATSGGVALVYSISSNVLTATAGPAGPTVFTLQVDPSGSYTFTLDRALDHPLVNGDDNEQLTLNFASVLEAESAGGAPVDLAGAFLIHVEDDVPVVDILPNSAASVAEGSTYDGTWTHGTGGDGAGSIKVLVGSNEYNLDTNISLASGTLRVNSDGTWSFQAGSGLDQDVINSQTFSVRVRDYDQDTATDSFTIRITDAGSPTGGQASNAVDEEGLSGGITGGPNDAAGTGTTVTGNLGYSFGPDGAAPVGAFTWSTAGLPALTSGGTALTYSVSADGLTLTAAKVGGGATVFTVKVTNASTGAYEFKLLQPLDHAAPVSPTGSDENNIDLSFAYTVKDDDGSTANGSLGISVDDDSPTVNLLPDAPVNVAEGTTYSSGTWTGGYGADGGGSAKVLVGANEYNLNTNIALDTGILRVNSNGTWSFQAANGLDQDVYNSQSFSVQVRDYDQDTVIDSVTINITDAAKPSGGTANNAVDEEGLSNGITGGPNDAAGIDTTVTGNLGYSFGPDGAAPVGAFTWNTAGLPALASGGTALTYSVSADGLTLTAAKVGGGATVFTVKVTDVATGAYEFKLLLPLDHQAPASPTGSDENNIGLSFSYTVKDDDGSTANGSLGISVDDDSPAVNLLPDAPVSVAEGTSYNSGIWTSGYGADGAGSIKVLIGANEYNLDADIALATGTLRVNSDGTWSFQAANGLDQDVINSQSFSVRVRDYDQDTVTDSVTINITDAAKPTGGTANNAVDEDGLANGVAGGPNDAAGADTTVTGNLGYSFGADGAAPTGAFTWSTGGLPALTSGGTALTYSVSSDGLTLTAAKVGGGATVFTVKVTDVATGAYEFKLLLPLDHSAPVSPVTSDENNINLNFSYTVKDDDGSTANGSLGISVDDDSPTAKDNSISVTEGGVPPFNLILVVDTSGSMLYEIGGNTQGSPNRLELAKEALSNMIDSYAALGVDLAITVIDFATGALLIPQTTDPDVAKLNIQNLATDGGNTNYNAPLVLAQNQLTADLVNLPDYEHKVYFLSDGQPNVGNVPAGWTSFINASGAEVYAVGLSVSSNAGAIAQLGLVEDHGDAVTLIDDPYDLDATLQATVPQPTMGNMVTDVDPVAGVDTSGADVPVTVTQISFVAANPAAYIGVADSVVGNVVTFLVQGGTTGPITTPLGGTLVVNANGSYSYTPPNDVLVDSQEVFTYTIVDKDGDQSSANLNISVLDTSPIVANVYEDGLPNGLPDPGSNVTSVSGTLAGAVVDSAGVIFSLGSVAGLPALTADGVPITYSVVDGPTSDTLTAKAGTVNIFTLVLQANGNYTFNLLGAIDHATANGDDQELKDLDLSSIIVAKEGATNVPLIRDFIVQVEDDVPVIQSTSNLVYSNSNNPGGATGVFDYSTGADTRDTGPFSASDSDFKSITLTGSVGGVAISSQSVTWVSESATTATFDVEFEYAPNPSNPGVKEQAEGTLTFDKVNGTYTVTLDGPIEGFQVLKTSANLGIVGYVPGSSTVDNTNPDVAVSQLASDFFVQFRGYAEPGAGTGGNNLQTGGANTNIFVNGELFSQASSYVTLSNTSNGVAGDTIGQGEVLDLNFYTSSPTGNLAVTPTGRADGIFLKFDGINSEDLVVVLKLIGPGGVTTTRALVINNSDIYRNSSGATALAALAVYGITLDNNDGAIVIENNDFNGAGESWQIYGAQILTTVEGITTSTAINYDNDFGESGGSTLTTNFNNQTDNDVVKVSDIGFIKTQTTTVDAELDFQVAVQDADNDATSSVNLHVTIEAGNTFTGTALADLIQGSTGNDTLSGLAGDDVLIGGLGNDLLIGGADNDTYRWTAGNTGTDTVQGFVNNFNGNAQGDRLDLSQLLTGEHGQAGDIGNLLSFIDISTANLGGGAALDTVIKVSDTSTADPATSTEQTIVLQDVNLVSLYGGTESGTILGMLGDGTLKVDVA